MTIQKKFTEQEDDFIKENRPSMQHKEIAISLNRTTSSIRNRCWILRLVDVSDNWTLDQIELLKHAYNSSVYADEIDLPLLSIKLKKLKSNVCRKARELGLTDNSRELKKIKKKRNKFDSPEEVRAHLSACSKDYIKKNGHPRGSLGMKHTDKTKAIIAEKSRIRYSEMTEEEKSCIAIKARKTRDINGTMQTMNRANASWGCGWREIGGVRKYYRSKWEANYARYLEWLKSKGEIQSWLHEPETFWFEGIKRGCLSYLPDFRVVEKNGSIAYHEVKGWMDDRSKTKIRRMAIYHPKTKLIVIDSKGYAAIKKIMQPIISDWETDSKGR